MKLSRLALCSLSLVALFSAAAPAFAQTHFYAASSVDNANDKWNDANARRKWTATGAAWVGATAGNIYHTNGFSVKAGSIGNPSGGKPNPYAFVGAKLIVDGFSDASKLPGTGAGAGEIHFEVKTGLDAGPRQVTPAKAVKGTYVADIVIAPTTGAESRAIRGSFGMITLNGTLALDGNTKFTTGSVNDMVFLINAPVTGTGNIEFSGGNAGGKMANGWLTWAFKDLTGWRGALIAVQHKHTIAFSGPADFQTTNPNLTIAFSPASPGFINLSANVSIGAGKFRYGKHTPAPGVYTAAQLNALHAAEWGGQAAFPFASGGGSLYVGQPLPAK